LFVGILPLNGFFGSDGGSIAPGLELVLPVNRVVVSGEANYAVFNQTADMVKGSTGFTLPKSWGYALEVSYVLNSSSDSYDFPVYKPGPLLSSSTTYSSYNDFMTGQTVHIEKTTNTYGEGEYTGETGHSRSTSMNAVHFGIRGGRRLRDFSYVFDKDIALPLMKVDGTETNLTNAPGGLYGSAVQHALFGGVQHFGVVEKDNGQLGFFRLNYSLYADVMVLLKETLGENVYELDKPYFITNQTAGKIPSSFIGIRTGVDFRLGITYSRIALGIDPGTGRSYVQIGTGIAL
jgi:hypothetical protein